MKVRDDLHHLIDTIEDEQLLKSYLQLIQGLTASKSGELWNKLSEEQKAELISAYDESFEQDNLITNDAAKQQHAKWLE